VSVRACARTWFGGVNGFVILCARFLADLRFEVDSRACTLERLGFSTPRVHPGWLGEPLATPDEHGLRCSAPPRQRQPLSPGRGGGQQQPCKHLPSLPLSLLEPSVQVSKGAPPLWPPSKWHAGRAAARAAQLIGATAAVTALRWAACGHAAAGNAIGGDVRLRRRMAAAMYVARQRAAQPRTSSRKLMGKARPLSGALTKSMGHLHWDLLHEPRRS
jgi:hypothetical protein